MPAILEFKMLFSPHFSFDEMTRTSTGILNKPDTAHVIELTRLCNLVLEPIRALLDAPLIVHSGYRCQGVNEAVGGARNSAHLSGRACDFHPGNENLIREEFEKALNSSIPFDRLMLEYKNNRYWMHAEVPKIGQEPRRLGYVGIYDPDSGLTKFREVKRR